jgi:deazaflavin-dependent oxidoreductase (nitroreductase family)
MRPILAATTDVRDDEDVTGFRKWRFRTGLRLASALHRTLYRLSRGRAANSVWHLSILLLTTTGRKSGTPRTTPLCYFTDGDDLIVVASNGGMDWFPDWWLNLLSEPRATVEIGRSRRTVVARQAAPDERERLWSALTAIAPGYLEYQKRTRREIPLGILQPPP